MKLHGINFKKNNLFKSPPFNSYYYFSAMHFVSSARIFRTQSLVPFLQMSGDPGLIQQQPTTQQSDPNFVTNTSQDPVQNQMNNGSSANMGPCNDQFGSAINQMVSL